MGDNIHMTMFTPREISIMELVITGHCYKDVASELKLSLATIKKDMELMRVKYNVWNTCQLVAMYVEWKILTIRKSPCNVEVVE